MDQSPASARSDDADISAVAPHPLVRAAGFIAVVHGGGLLLVALQSYLWLLQPSRFVLVLGTELVLGAVVAYAGARLAAMRGWAAPMALGGSAIGTLLSSGWALYALVHGFVSLMALAMVPLGVLALVFEGIALPSALRADRARERLRDKGLDFGG